MTGVEQMRTHVDRRKGKRDQVEQYLEDAVTQLMHRRELVTTIGEAQAIVQTIAQATQKELEYHVSEIVSLALDAVFPDPYRLGVAFELRRGRSEADLTFGRGGDEPIHPMTAAGGGAVDVAAFALRVSLWSLAPRKTRPTLVLDEPFRFLSRDLQPRAGKMLKEISEKLGLQMIIVSHETDLIENANKVFEVKLKKGRSTVE